MLESVLSRQSVEAEYGGVGTHVDLRGSMDEAGLARGDYIGAQCRSCPLHGFLLRLRNLDANVTVTADTGPVCCTCSSDPTARRRRVELCVWLMLMCMEQCSWGWGGVVAAVVMMRVVVAAVTPVCVHVGVASPCTRTCAPTLCIARPMVPNPCIAGMSRCYIRVVVVRTQLEHAEAGVVLEPRLTQNVVETSQLAELIGRRAQLV